MIKIPGVPTGTVDAVAQNGERARWKPHGDLTLVVSETAAAQNLPREIKGNPDAETGIKMQRERDKRMARGPLGRFLDWAFRRGEFPAVRESARLFVGHNVQNEEYWRSGEVYLAGYLAREAQLKTRSGAIPAFSFYVGLGAFPSDRGNNITAEESSQFVFINFSQSRTDFIDDMFRLAGELAKMMSQESVLLEISEKGKVSVYDYIEPTNGQWTPKEKTRDLLRENAYRIQEKVWNKQ